MRVASPPLQYPCLYGIDTPGQHDLSACEMNLEQLTEHIGADSLQFLSLSGLQVACGDPGTSCSACFTGHYPVAPSDAIAASIRHIEADWFFGRQEAR
jgi:amidophosphoribosyltransferase